MHVCEPGPALVSGPPLLAPAQWPFRPPPDPAGVTEAFLGEAVLVERARSDAAAFGQLYEHYALLGIADQVRTPLHGTEIDPHFMRKLRAAMIGERERAIAEWSEPRRRFRPPLLPELRWPGRMVAAGAGVATALALALQLTLVVLWTRQPPPAPVTASSVVSGMVSVDAAEPVMLRFDRPMDHAAVAASLRIVPATASSHRSVASCPTLPTC